MYHHILIAVDGSEHAARATEQGLRLARTLQARVTAVTIIPPWAKGGGYDAVWDTDTLYKERARATAEQQLQATRQAAREHDVALETDVIESDQVYVGILQAARDKGCDLILMGTHGRGGLSALLLGSVAAKVMTHADRPVLVCR